MMPHVNNEKTLPFVRARRGHFDLPFGCARPSRGAGGGERAIRYFSTCLAGSAHKAPGGPPREANLGEEEARSLSSRLHRLNYIESAH